MSENLTVNDIQKMTPEEIAELNRKMGKRALRNLLILMGIKWAVIYSINRWARSMDKNN